MIRHNLYQVDDIVLFLCSLLLLNQKDLKIERIGDVNKHV